MPDPLDPLIANAAAAQGDFALFVFLCVLIVAIVVGVREFRDGLEGRLTDDDVEQDTAEREESPGVAPGVLPPLPTPLVRLPAYAVFVDSDTARERAKMAERN